VGSPLSVACANPSGVRLAWVIGGAPYILASAGQVVSVVLIEIRFGLAKRGPFRTFLSKAGEHRPDLVDVSLYTAFM
jgi:hypothetical protein